MITDNEILLKAYQKARIKATHDLTLRNGAVDVKEDFRRALGGILGCSKTLGYTREEYLRCVTEAYDEMNYLQEEIIGASHAFNHE